MTDSDTPPEPLTAEARAREQHEEDRAELLLLRLGGAINNGKKQYELVRAYRTTIAQEARRQARREALEDAARIADAFPDEFELPPDDDNDPTFGNMIAAAIRKEKGL